MKGITEQAFILGRQVYPPNLAGELIKMVMEGKAKQGPMFTFEELNPAKPPVQQTQNNQ